MLVDCLIFFILKNANLRAQQQVSKLEEQTSLSLANASFDLLTTITNLTPISLPAEFQGRSGAVDTSRYLDRESSNASPLSLREKLVRSVLHTYTTEVPLQHQTFANAKAEELLKAIAANTSLDFVGQTATDLISDMEPPRLQAVLRMTEVRIKQLITAAANGSHQMSEEDLENLIRLATMALAPQLNNTVPDVRKTVVFCLVEVGEAMGLQLFATEVMEKHLNISQ